MIRKGKEENVKTNVLPPPPPPPPPKSVFLSQHHQREIAGKEVLCVVLKEGSENV